MDRQQIGVKLAIDGLNLPFKIEGFQDRPLCLMVIEQTYIIVYGAADASTSICYKSS